MSSGLLKYNEKYVLVPFAEYDLLKKRPIATSRERKRDQALEDVPKSRHSMARALITLLDLSTNENLEVVVDEAAIRGSNIKEFMKFTQVDSSKDPLQARHLYGLLSSADFPLTLIGNARLSSFLRELREPEEKKVRRKWVKIP